jgi:hypothetical protein
VNDVFAAEETTGSFFKVIDQQTNGADNEYQNENPCISISSEG